MLQYSSPVATSVAQVVVFDEPPGLPRARAQTEYVVVPSFSGSGLGSWNAAEPSVPFLSSTSNGPSESRILVDPVSGTKITFPDPLLIVFPLGTPMILRL